MTTLQWMAYAIAISTLLGAAAALLERVLQPRGLAVRGIWTVAMAGSVGAFLLTASSTTPDTRLADALVRSAVQQALEADPTAVAGTARAASGTTVEQEGNAPAFATWRPVVTARPGIVTRAAAWGDWIDSHERRIVLATVLLVPLLVLVEKVRLARRRRSWRSARLDGVPVLVAPDFGPALVGIVTPEIVVPEYVRAMPPEQREMLLLHEQEHLRAHDGRLAMLSLVLVALCPWNPALLWQFVRLRLAIEIDCDRRVLRRRNDVRGYGALLLDVASRSAGVGLQATAFSERGSSLGRRIAGIAPSRHERGAARSVLSGLAALVALGASCVTPRPTEPPQTLARTVPGPEIDRALGWLEGDSIFVWRDSARVAAGELLPSLGTFDAVKAADGLPGRFIARPQARGIGEPPAACPDRLYDVGGRGTLVLLTSVEKGRMYQLRDTVVFRRVSHGYYRTLGPERYGVGEGQLLRVGCREGRETHVRGVAIDMESRAAIAERSQAIERGRTLKEAFRVGGHLRPDSVLVSDGRVHLAFIDRTLADLDDDKRWSFSEQAAAVAWRRYARDAGVDTVTVAIVMPSPPDNPGSPSSVAMASFYRKQLSALRW